MIFDKLSEAQRYTALHPLFARAFEFLTTTDLAALEPGRHELDGARMFVLVNREAGRGTEGARLEAHRRYLDIQLSLDGREQIGWLPLSECSQPAGPFEVDRDIVFFSDRPAAWIPLPRDCFMVFFPEDAHAPLGGEGPLGKVVVKIALEA